MTAKKEKNPRWKLAGVIINLFLYALCRHSPAPYSAIIYNINLFCKILQKRQKYFLKRMCSSFPPARTCGIITSPLSVLRRQSTPNELKPGGGVFYRYSDPRPDVFQIAPVRCSDQVPFPVDAHFHSGVNPLIIDFHLQRLAAMKAVMLP